MLLGRDGVFRSVGEMEEIGQGMQAWGEPACGRLTWRPKMLPAPTVPTPSSATRQGVCTQGTGLGLPHQLTALGPRFHLSQNRDVPLDWKGKTSNLAGDPQHRSESWSPCRWVACFLSPLFFFPFLLIFNQDALQKY